MAGDQDLGVERGKTRHPVSRWIRIGDTAAEGATIPDRAVTDAASDPGKKIMTQIGNSPVFDRGMGYAGTDGDVGCRRLNADEFIE